MRLEEFKNLADKYGRQKASSQEKLSMDIFLSKVQKANSSLVVPLSSEKREKLLNTINNRIHKPSRNRLWVKRSYGIAAIFAAIITLAFFTDLFSSKVTTIIAEKGEKKEIKLDDGSVILLNGNSQLSYNHDFTEARLVKLKGEAFFKVAKNPEKPFIVESSSLRTRVLGTSFNIKNYEGERAVVSVNTGRVEVTPKAYPKKKVILTKNEQVTYTRNFSARVSKENSEDFNAWTRKMIILKQASLGSTATILENWYNVHINFAQDSLRTLKITGKFKDEKLKNILKSIALIKNLQIDSTNQKHIIIRTKPAAE
ncbi:FecR domain-containing protein [Gillisia sp. M10.2A]|uniref:FecR domain-containing protein n=1 Tax=Gillisia lutea TaxID=2909668 RepID=A0ABS9EH62_9FLAO|nr:FecR domain-containing protein [Gillisia lutea]MCF4100786.1 FecR domain-containing protein [Gillisia lutea]